MCNIQKECISLSVEKGTRLVAGLPGKVITMKWEMRGRGKQVKREKITV